MKFGIRKDFDVVSEFKDYVVPLAGLEACFNNAGVSIEFTLTIWDDKTNLKPGKAVVIDYHAHYSNSISIEGDSPAQAVKRVAEVLELKYKDPNNDLAKYA